MGLGRKRWVGVCLCMGVTAASGAAAIAQASAADTPSFAPVNAKTTEQFTTCASLCFVRDLLFEADWKLTVPVYPTVQGPTSLPQSPRVVLQSAQNGKVHTISDPKRISFDPASGTGSEVKVIVDLSGLLGPGDYTGALVFGVSGSTTPVSVPVEVQVREGPWWPLVLLVAMILLGMAITWVLSRQDKVTFTTDARELKSQIDALPESERAILTPLWNDVWGERGRNFTEAQTHLTALTNGVAALSDCRDLQDEVLHSSYATQLPKWVQRVGDATQQVIYAVLRFTAGYDAAVGLVRQTQNEFETAAAAKAEVDELVSRAQSASSRRTEYRQFLNKVKAFQAALDGVPTTAAQPVPDLGPPLGAVKTAFDALEQAHGQRLELAAGPGPAPAGVGGAVAGAVAGLLDWRPEGLPAPAPGDQRAVQFDLVTTLVGGLSTIATAGVALVLLAIGFKVTYLGSPTFGATLADWLTLAFWGLAAYGVRQTLTGLGPSSK